MNQDPVQSIDSLSWDDLLSLKRGLVIQVKDLTAVIIDIEKNRIRLLNESIQKDKNEVVTLNGKLAEIRAQMNSNNSQLLATSEKISQFKNFVSTMGPRLPSEDEEVLIRTIGSSQRLVNEKCYKNEREKLEILTVMNDASMKLEAIKAIRTGKEQLETLTRLAEDINKTLKALHSEREAIENKVADAQSKLDSSYQARREQASERHNCLKKYDETLSALDTVNSRLDEMSRWRKRQRQEFGYRLRDDALFKVKESTKRKVQAGGKVDLEELRLLYDVDELPKEEK
jgi:uncharacterized coiled-coil DUF342 family protein